LPIDPLDYSWLPNTKSYMYEPVLASYWVLTRVGQFSFFCENCLILVLSWCYENLIGSLIYNFLEAGENRSGYQIFIFLKSPGSQISQFSYIHSNNQFSHSIFTTWFSLIKIKFIH
jgi:hypothetical protein